MKVKRFIAAILCFAMCFGFFPILTTGVEAAEADSQNTALSWDFESSDTVDPAFVQLNSNDEHMTLEIAQDPTNPSNKVLHIGQHFNGDKVNKSGETLIPIGELKEKSTIEYRFCVSQAQTSIFAITEGDSQTVAAEMAVRFLLRPAMSINSFNGSKEVSFAEYEANKWYTLKFVIDPEAKIYSLYLDGAEMMKDAAFYNKYTGAGVLSALAIGPIKSCAEADIYIDDIKVYAGDNASVPDVTPPDEDAVPVINQNFDNMTVGNSPDGWDVSGTATVQPEKSDSRGNMLRVYDQCGDTGAYLQAFYHFPSDAEITEISFNYMSLAAGVEARNYFRFTPGSATRFYVMAKNANDTPVVYQNDKATKQQIVLGEWYKVALKKTDSGVDLYFNDTFLYTFSGGMLSYAEFFSRNPKTGGVGCEFYIDDLTLTKADGSVYMSDDFSKMESGSTPSGYTAENGSGWEVVLHSDKSGELLSVTVVGDQSYSPTGNSLCIEDNSNTAVSSASYSFDETGGANISFAYKMDSIGANGANVIEVLGKDGAVKLKLSVIKNADGKASLYYYDTKSGKNVDTGYEIKADKWYDFGLLVFDSDAAELKENGKSICDIPVNTSVNTISGITFRSKSTEGVGDVFRIDDVVIDTNRIPTIEPTAFVDKFDSADLANYSVNGACVAENGVLKLSAKASAERKFNPVYSGKFSVTLNGAALAGTRLTLTSGGIDVMELKVGDDGGIFYKRDDKWVGTVVPGTIKNGENNIIAIDLPNERNVNYANIKVNSVQLGTAMYNITFETIDGFKLYAPDGAEISSDDVSAEASDGIIAMPDRTASDIEVYLSEKISGVKVMYKLGDKGAAGAMEYANSNTAFTFDENHNSVGVDLGKKQAVNTIKLTFKGVSEATINNTSGALTHFRTMGVYVSDDNKTYTLINENSTGTARTTYDDGKGNAVMVFDFSGIEARYVKINYGMIDHNGLNSARTDGGYLKMNDLENSVEAKRRIARQWKLGGDVIALAGDSTPSSGKMLQIYTNEPYTVKTGDSVGYDFGIKSNFEALEIVGSGVSEIKKEDIKLYYSNDGNNYSEIIKFVISRDKDTIRFTFDSVNAVYIKLNINGSNISVTIDDPTKDFSVYSSVEAASSFDYIRHVAARGSEGDFVALSDGTLIMSHIHYSTTTTGDNGDCALAICRSTDNGRTWSETARIVTKTNPTDLNVMHPELLELEDGKIGLFYVERPTVGETPLRLRISEDNGYTWSEPTAILEYPDDGLYSFTSGRAVIRHPNGRIIVAFIFAAVKSDTSGGDRTLCYTAYSDDNGKTWKRSNNGVALPNSALEPGVAVLDNGDLLMTFRTRKENNIYHSISQDGGVTWSQPVAVEGLDTPSANQSLLSIPGTDDVVIFWSNEEYSPTSKDNGNGERYKLSTAISSDHGLTYHNIRNVTEGLGGGGFWPVPVIYGRTVLVQFGGALQVMTFDVAQLYSSLEGDISLLPKSKTPTAKYDHSTGVLSNISANTLYSLDEGKTWVFAGGSTVELDKYLTKILIKDNGSATEAPSEIQTLTSGHTPASTLISEENVHYNACTNCGAKLNEAEHVYAEWKPNGDGTHSAACVCEKTVTDSCSGGEASCKDKAVCTVCGESYGELNTEAHDYGDYTSENDGHSKKCGRCGAETASEAHKFEGKACSVCGFEKSGSADAVIAVIASVAIIGIGAAAFVFIKKKK